MLAKAEEYYSDFKKIMYYGEPDYCKNSLLHCCGSGSGSMGSVCFGPQNPDPDPDPQQTDCFSPAVSGLQNGKIVEGKKACLPAFDAPSPSPLLACVYVTCGLWAGRKLNSHTRYDISIFNPFA